MTTDASTPRTPAPAGHTPGPWKLKRSGTIYAGDEGELVATTGYRVRVGSDEDEANARLIADAPTLLGALESLCNTTGDEHADALVLARALLAKHTEESSHDR